VTYYDVALGRAARRRRATLVAAAVIVLTVGGVGSYAFLESRVSASPEN
jgi:tRNA A37 threonylcarbamoyladenosine dehydratase